MRLWHQSLLPVLDNPRLLDLHRTCCNLRGNGWFKKNSAVQYALNYIGGQDALCAYHFLVMKEMDSRGIQVNPYWIDPSYCGANRPAREFSTGLIRYYLDYKNGPIYPFHDYRILMKDVEDLIQRGLPLRIDSTSPTQVIISREDKYATKYALYKYKKGEVEA